MSTIEQEIPGSPKARILGKIIRSPAQPRVPDEALATGPKPASSEYGFVSLRGDEVASSRERMVYMTRTSPAPSLVWAPETEAMVPPWQVPWMLDAMRVYKQEELRGEMRTALLWSGGILVFCTFLHWGMAILALPVLAVALSNVQIRVSTALSWTAEQFRAEAEAHRKAVARLVEYQQFAVVDTRFTMAVAYPILATCALQLLTLNMAGREAALDPQAARSGEWWRLLTAPLLHAHPLHIWMNYSALLGLGRLMEGSAPRGWVPLVFVLTAVAGGLASVALPPDVPSVGASGGLLGMLGFLLVIGYRRRSTLPGSFLKDLLKDVGLIALMGLFAFQMIDNAAHAGGLVTGLAIGIVAVPSTEAATEWTGGRAVELAGHAAVVLLWVSVALVVGAVLASVHT
ncbi:rhomboid family intramembrane serine protease [Longimicrobium sp.]|uniref:rhomboid family intramembrane serine protease n=1 Tax=Longimicrobium sp. TaxID=2029185 RepID=UPI002ED9D3DC